MQSLTAAPREVSGCTWPLACPMPGAAPKMAGRLRSEASHETSARLGLPCACVDGDVEAIAGIAPVVAARVRELP